MFRESTYAECKPLLLKLWPAPSWQPVIDNVAGSIGYTGDEYSQMRIQYFLWEERGEAVGTTHMYTTGEDRLRIRGTFVEPRLRGQRIGQRLILSGLEYFQTHVPDCRVAYTYPREGTQRFYESMGFTMKERMRYPAYSQKGCCLAEKTLR